MPFGRLLPAGRAGEVDAAPAAVTINAEREEALDFSYAYMDSGLRVLTSLDREPGMWRVARAVVFGGPPLLYWVSQHPAAAVALIPEAINHEAYGVAFPEGSELREPVNRALLSLRENGRYERLYAEWFGDE